MKRVSIPILSALFLLPTAALAPAQGAPGAVLWHAKISSTQGGFTGVPDQFFGASVASLGDLDGDGVDDLAVGELGSNDGGSQRGAVWILFLDADQTVKAHQKISSTHGGFAGALGDSDFFGRSVAALGDLDGDGVTDLAVGAIGDDDGTPDAGAVWILFLNADGTVKGHQKISQTQGGFVGTLDQLDQFGYALAAIGDLDDDGVVDLACGADGDDDNAGNSGAIWVLFLNTDGTVRQHQKISGLQGGIPTPNFTDRLGQSVAALGDLDGDGIEDLATGLEGTANRGEIWVLFLRADGTVRALEQIEPNQAGFAGVLDDFDHFGWSTSAVDDLDGDSVRDLAVGAIQDDDGGPDRGAVWILFMNTDGTVKGHQKISDTTGGFTGALDDVDRFGWALAAVGDLNGDGIADLATTAQRDDDGGADRGAVWLLCLDGVTADTDGDGLTDDDEVDIYGTDPNDPDSDDDGLMDGVEVDMAQGTGCPDPLDADSDGDLISDGGEVANGSDPCTSDTDEDGLCDLIDSSPTVPSASTGATEDATRALADVLDAFDLGVFSGPNANADAGRRNSLSSRIRNAANRIADGHESAAIVLLQTALAKVDGQGNDWMHPSPERDALASCLVSLIEMLG